MSRMFLILVFLFCVSCTLRSAGQVTAATPASADVRQGERMLFKFQGTATGSFQPENEAATTFAAKPFTIIATANGGEVATSESYCAVPAGTCTILRIPVTSATISVDGLTATIESPIAVFDNQTFPALGLTRQKSGGDLLDLQGKKVFETYALNSDLEPSDLFFKTPRKLGQFNCAHGCLMTSRGPLAIDWVQNVRVTATHTSAQIP